MNCLKYIKLPRIEPGYIYTVLVMGSHRHLLSFALKLYQVVFRHNFVRMQVLTVRKHTYYLRRKVLSIGCDYVYGDSSGLREFANTLATFFNPLLRRKGSRL